MPTPPTGNPTPKGSLLDSLQLVFLIASAFGIFFYFQGPAKNDAQAVFRLAVVGGGTVGLLIVTLLKVTRKKDS